MAMCTLPSNPLTILTRHFVDDLLLDQGEEEEEERKKKARTPIQGHLYWLFDSSSWPRQVK
jgi:hypothetical protein